MITVTPTAAIQIRIAAKKGEMEDMPLRLAVSKTATGEFQYAMGFDDEEHEGDQTSVSEEVSVVVNVTSFALLEGTTIDYLELDPGKFHFVFLNPQDPNYLEPSED